MLKRDKRGIELSINTLVIAILVILTLIIIVIFFLGGAKRVTDTISGIFFKTTAGTDKSLAIQTCGTYCDQALSLPQSLRKGSSYCKSWFNIDTKGKGEADSVDVGSEKKYKKFYCWKIDSDVGSDVGDVLGVACIERDTNTQLTC